jgi:undecaprenyl diphosphate synthase
MDLLHHALTAELDFYMNNDVRLRVIGRREGLSERLLAAIDAAEKRTAANARGQLNICINYGGRAELVDAARKIVADGARPEEVTEERIAASMWTAGIPDPDLIVRTSGEQRLSGFLTWSGVYSELSFVDVHWPAFGVGDLDAAIAEYESRQRRFGK